MKNSVGARINFDAPMILNQTALVGNDQRPERRKTYDSSKIIWRPPIRTKIKQAERQLSLGLASRLEVTEIDE